MQAFEYEGGEQAALWNIERCQEGEILQPDGRRSPFDCVFISPPRFPDFLFSPRHPSPDE